MNKRKELKQIFKGGVCFGISIILFIIAVLLWFNEPTMDAWDIPILIIGFIATIFGLLGTREMP